MSELERRRITKEEREARRNYIKKVRLISLSILILFSTTIGFVIGLHVDHRERLSDVNEYVSYVRENETIVYETYQINPGDTLIDISKELVAKYNIPVNYQLEMSYIMEINSITNPDRINQWDYIVFPYIK